MRLLLLTLFFVLVGIGVRAETIVINRPNPGAPAPARGQRVTMNITISTTGAGGATESGAWTAEMSGANRALFEVVSHECEVLGAVLQGTCTLKQITTTGGVGDRAAFGVTVAPGTSSVNVTANVTFEIEPKNPYATPVPAPR